MHPILWLAGKELAVRKISLHIGLIMCSLIISMFITVEWTLRTRESQVRQDLDQMGPPLIVVPAGKSIMDLRRFDLGPRYFHESKVVEPLIEGLKQHIRAVDYRLSTRLPVEGNDIPVVGIDASRVVSPHEALRRLNGNSVALGKIVADNLGVKAGEDIRIAGSRFWVKTVLSSAGNTSDMAVFMPISQLRGLTHMSGGFNEIRIYPKSAPDLELIREQLNLSGNALHTIVVGRGEVTENKIAKSLAHNRHAVYLMLGMILSVSMMIWTYLDTKERQVELATISAIDLSSQDHVALLQN